MSLETPNRTRASAVLLFQNFDDPDNETVEFASNNGFSSVAFIDPTDVAVGVVLPMDQPVTNQEGAVAVAGDPTLIPGQTAGYITPNHFQLGISEIDDLDPFQCAVVGLVANDPVFRLYVTVLAMTAVLPTDPNEPVAP